LDSAPAETGDGQPVSSARPRAVSRRKRGGGGTKKADKRLSADYDFLAKLREDMGEETDLLPEYQLITRQIVCEVAEDGMDFLDSRQQFWGSIK